MTRRAELRIHPFPRLFCAEQGPRRRTGRKTPHRHRGQDATFPAMHSRIRGDQLRQPADGLARSSAGKGGEPAGIRRALQLDEAERTHLFDLARAANTTVTTARTPRHPVHPGVQSILDAMVTAPAYVRNGRLDILATNQLGRAVFSPLFAPSIRPASIARCIFLDPASRELYVEWDRLA
jgi:hypothetical protein